jgi:hypothetical protein
MSARSISVPHSSVVKSFFFSNALFFFPHVPHYLRSRSRICAGRHLQVKFSTNPLTENDSGAEKTGQEQESRPVFSCFPPVSRLFFSCVGSAIDFGTAKSGIISAPYSAPLAGQGWGKPRRAIPSPGGNAHQRNRQQQIHDDKEPDAEAFECDDMSKMDLPQRPADPRHVASDASNRKPARQASIQSTMSNSLHHPSGLMLEPNSGPT